MKRRDFLAALATGACAVPAASQAGETQPAGNGAFPRRRGFNLLEKFTLNRNAPYVERDFEWMARWGFDFARLPTDYRCWTDPDDPKKLDKTVLKHIDEAVEYGRQYGVHINLNLHRAPGYCVNPPVEPLDLWTSDEALALFCFQWKTFAERYKGISSERLSFDLLNEPKGGLGEAAYVRVMMAAIEAIREADPERKIVVDGLRWGREPVYSLANAGVAQSTRGYDPMRVSHHKASWISGSENWNTPTWPLETGDGVWDKDRLRGECIEPFKKLEAMGAGVHVGECGAYRHTPHGVALAWFEDFLSLWKEAGWGWAVWNLRGGFGIADSGRDDVDYEDFEGHKLDRKMLELLRAY